MYPDVISICRLDLKAVAVSAAKTLHVRVIAVPVGVLVGASSPAAVSSRRTRVRWSATRYADQVLDVPAVTGSPSNRSSTSITPARFSRTSPAPPDLGNNHRQSV